MRVIEDGRVVMMLVALLTGAGAGAWFAHSLARRRLDDRVRQATDALQQQHMAVLDRFRAAHARLHADLEQQRLGTARQVAAAVAEQQASVRRLDERLRVAYAELDRIRDVSSGKPPRPLIEDHGFAATQPMHTGM